MTPHSLMSSIALTALCGVLTGCTVLQPKADLTQFYVLRAQPVGSEDLPLKESALPEFRVGAGRIPGYLDNQRIAVQAGANRIEYLDLHRWAEPLSRNLSRVLGEHFAARLDSEQVSVHPDPALKASGYELRYMVDRFEGPRDGPVRLEVAWHVVERPSSQVIVSRRSVYEVSPDQAGRDVAAYVERLSEAVGLWANDVAAALP